MSLTSGVFVDRGVALTEDGAALVIPEASLGHDVRAKVRGFERVFYDGVWWLHAAPYYHREQFFAMDAFDFGKVGPEEWDLDQRTPQLRGTVSPVQQQGHWFDSRRTALLWKRQCRDRRTVSDQCCRLGSLSKPDSALPEQAWTAL